MCYFFCSFSTLGATSHGGCSFAYALIALITLVETSSVCLTRQTHSTEFYFVGNQKWISVSVTRLVVFVFFCRVFATPFDYRRSSFDWLLFLKWVFVGYLLVPSFTEFPSVGFGSFRFPSLRVLQGQFIVKIDQNVHSLIDFAMKRQVHGTESDY